jgi:hypothetical protein
MKHKHRHSRKHKHNKCCCDNPCIPKYACNQIEVVECKKKKCKKCKSSSSSSSSSDCDKTPCDTKNQCGPPPHIFCLPREGTVSDIKYFRAMEQIVDAYRKITTQGYCGPYPCAPCVVCRTCGKCPKCKTCQCDTAKYYY